MKQRKYGINTSFNNLLSFSPNKFENIKISNIYNAKIKTKTLDHKCYSQLELKSFCNAWRFPDCDCSC